ncbi:MAG TPA: putative 2-dehydropantoate 2-reductase [Cyanobacteria bacterium UBA11369]|nr:putative 2-dehydropantoate 2-reductase [Cyanobacteria bacterium UBA11371]HBE35311.1 putative 2-dehydropantoate 2-reductase [Cyanobacteria bacterium UBA11368]HBE50129.1 putative 2-dehydropantoate 2-reductase [Cyanobacteria bacterium UBA11369]
MIGHFNYAILGTGALGGFYGARLQRAGFEVHFLLHGDYEHVSQHGLIVESPNGDFALPSVRAYCDTAKMPRCDVVVVSLKTTHNYLLPKLLPNVLKDDGVVLVLQNGLGVEEEVARIVGAERVMGGLCFLCSNKIAPFHIRHLAYGEIKLAEYAANYQPQGITERMRQIAADFETAGISIHLEADLLFARWQKLVWNIPDNGLSVILDAQTDELMENASTRTLVEELMWEVVKGAAACDRQIPNTFIDHMLDYTLNMTPYRTSMKIDYDEKRPMEVETMFGNPLRMAQNNGVELSKIAMLYQQLKFLDEINCR